MEDALIGHVRRFVSVRDEDVSSILAHFRLLHYDKKELLLQAGQLCRLHFFVVKGCLRMYFVNDKGVEQTIQFAIENWWMTDQMAFAAQQPSEFFIQATEDTQVLALDHHSQERLLESHPVMERYFRQIYQRAFAASQWRIKYLYDFSREELYHHFNDHFPEFVQRVPQYMLASFLGFTPEYLSEIRKKKRS